MTTAQLAGTAPAAVSRIEMMLNGARRLPSNLQTLFQALYMRNLNDMQARAELGMSEQAFHDSKQDLIRRLKAASS